MALQMLFMALILWTANVLADCVNLDRTTGVATIVAYRFFTNNTLALIDSRNHYFLYSSGSSVPFYQETLNVPIEDGRNGKTFFIYAAVIGSSSELYLASSSNKSFVYKAGQVNDTGTINRIYSNQFESIPLRSFSANPITFWVPYVDIWAVNNGFLQVVDTMDQATMYLNKWFITKVSANPLLKEFYVVTRSNTIYIAKLVQDGGGVWRMSPGNLDDQTAAIKTDSSVYQITTNVGANSNFIAYVGLMARDANGKYQQKLFVRKKSAFGTVATAVIDSFYAYSLAVHVTANAAYIMSTRGDIYTAIFNSVPSITSITLVVSAAGPKFCGLEFLATQKLIMKTSGWLQVIHLDLNNVLSLGSSTPSKPLYARSIPNSDYLLAVYSNSKVTLLDTVSSLSSPLFQKAGNIVEVVVNANSTFPRFYVLHKESLEVYSLNTWGLVASKTFAEIEVSINAKYPTMSLKLLQDIAICSAYPNTLVLLAIASNSTGVDSIMLSLNEASLSVSSVLITGYYINFQLVQCQKLYISEFDAFDAVLLAMPDYIYKYDYSSTTKLTADFMEKVDTRLPNTFADPTLSQMKFARFPMHKVPPNYASGPNTYASLFDNQYGYNRLKYGFDIGVWSVQGVVRLWADKRIGTVSEKIAGSLSGWEVLFQNDCLLMTQAAGNTSELCSDYLDEGIGFQRSDHKVIIYSNDDLVSSISRETCSVGALDYYQTITGSCKVSHCNSCSFLDEFYCTKCKFGYFTIGIFSTCSRCVGGFVLQDECVSACPIEYYKSYNSSDTNTYCRTIGECRTLALLVLGEYCGKVGSCPSGSSLVDGVCIPSNGRAADLTSMFTVNIPCSGGQLYWRHFNMCVSAGGLPSSNYTTSASMAYCDGGSYYYMLNTGRCELACGGFPGVDTTMGSFCAETESECSKLGFFVDSLSSGTPACKSSCLPNYFDMEAMRCTTKLLCASNQRFILETNSSCLEDCPATAFIKFANQCYSSCPAGSFLLQDQAVCVVSCPAMTNESFSTCVRALAAEIYSISIEEEDPNTAIIYVRLYFMSNRSELVTKMSVPVQTLVKNIVITDSDVTSSLELIRYVDEHLEITVRIPHLYSLTKVEFTLETNELLEITANAHIATFYQTNLTWLALRQPKILPYGTSLPIGISTFVTVMKVFGPLLMTTVLDVNTGNILCLIAQTYTKLVMMSHFSFFVRESQSKHMYYAIFREFLDGFNERLLLLLTGPKEVNMNKQVVCKSNYDKFCELTVEDSFFMAHLLALLLFAANCLLIYFLVQFLGYIKANKWRKFMVGRLKSIAPYGFLLENGLEFWFTMILSITIPFYPNAGLSSIKIIGHLAFIAFLAIFGIAIWFTVVKPDANSRNEATEPSGTTLNRLNFKQLGRYISSNFKSISSEVVLPKVSSSFMIAFMAHDFAFALLLVVGSYFAKAQILLWVFAELIIIGLLLNYKIFKQRSLFFRQLILETMFVVLSLTIGIMQFFPEQDILLTQLVLGISLVILFTDVGFFLFYILNYISRIFNCWKKQKNKVHSLETFRNIIAQDESNRIVIPSPLPDSPFKRSSAKSSTLKIESNRTMVQLARKSIGHTDQLFRKATLVNYASPINIVCATSSSRLVSLRSNSRDLGSIVNTPDVLTPALKAKQLPTLDI